MSIIMTTIGVTLTMIMADAIQYFHAVCIVASVLFLPLLCKSYSTLGLNYNKIENKTNGIQQDFFKGKIVRNFI